MEYLLEFVIDLIFELIIGIFDNSAQITLDTKRSKGIRILALVFAGICILVFLSVVGLLIWGGISLWPKNALCGIIIIGIGLLLLLVGLRKLRKAYKKENMRRNDKEVIEGEVDTDDAE